jgi:DNA-binding transcriptional regulator YiaG
VQVTRRSVVTDLVVTWTGWHANALRQALRMTNEEFGEHLDVSVRTVVYWRTRPDMVPRQGMKQILDAPIADSRRCEVRWLQRHRWHI